MCVLIHFVLKVGILSQVCYLKQKIGFTLTKADKNNLHLNLVSDMLANHTNREAHFTFLNVYELICIPKKGFFGLLTECGLNTFQMKSY